MVLGVLAEVTVFLHVNLAPHLLELGSFVMERFYLLEKIAERGYDVFSKRVSLSFGEKVSVLVRAWFARIFVRPLTA